MVHQTQTANRLPTHTRNNAEESRIPLHYTRLFCSNSYPNSLSSSSRETQLGSYSSSILSGIQYTEIQKNTRQKKKKKKKRWKKKNQENRNTRKPHDQKPEPHYSFDIFPIPKPIPSLRNTKKRQISHPKRQEKEKKGAVKYLTHEPPEQPPSQHHTSQ